MAGVRTKKRALYLAPSSSFSVDPSANGSAYVWVPTRQLGILKDDKAPIRTDYFTGRNYPTAPIAGPDGWSFDFRMPIWGLAAVTADNATAAFASTDVLDAILLHIFGSQVGYVTEGVQASGASSLTLDTDSANIQQLLAVHESGLPSAANGGERVQWAKITVDSGAGVYTIAPSWVQTPTTAAVAYGGMSYQPDDDGGNPLWFVYVEDDKHYTLGGGRCVSAALEWNTPGGMIELVVSWRGDTKLQETKGSLPAVGSAPPATPIRSTVSPMWFGGTRYQIGKCKIDLGVTAAVVEATEGAHGRGGDDSISLLPKITINPLRTDDIQNLKRNGGTPGRLLVQLGAGAVSGGVLNGCAFEAEEVSVMDAPVEDENGRLRNSITFEVTDKVIFTGSTLVSPVFQLVRA